MRTHSFMASASICCRILVLFALFGLIAGVGTGCRNKKKDDRQVTEKRTKTKKKTDPIEMDGPSPEELANSPCGNPDWAKLPPGMDASKTKKKEKAADTSAKEEEAKSPEINSEAEPVEE